MMAADLRSVLLASAGVTGIVSQRVSWAERPQGSALPALVLTQISGAPTYVLRGPSNYTEARVQVDCWASTFLAARQLADAVRAALSGFSGVRGSTRFHGVFLDAERDLRDAETDGAERFFRVSQDFMVHHSGA